MLSRFPRILGAFSIGVFGLVSVAAIQIGGSSSAGAATPGAAYTWGDNTVGELGDGTSGVAAGTTTPGSIALAPGVQATAVSASVSSYALAIGTDGNVYAWGMKNSGDLGDGASGGPDTCADPNVLTEDCSISPELVPLSSGVAATEVSAGSQENSMALGSDGNVYTWGDNLYGELGTGMGAGTDYFSLSPVSVTLAPGIGATAISAGAAFDMALGSNGDVYTWGSNGVGQLGDGSNTGPQVCEPLSFSLPCGTTPEPVTLPPGVTATAVSAGQEYAMAIGSDGNVYEWGDSPDGVGSYVPFSMSLAPGVSPVSIAAGSYSSMAIGSDGYVYWWGTGTAANGQASSSTPIVVPLPAGVTATAISNGWDTFAAIGSDGNVYSWGTSIVPSSAGIPPVNPTPVAISLASDKAASAISVASSSGIGFAIAIGVPIVPIVSILPSPLPSLPGIVTYEVSVTSPSGSGPTPTGSVSINDGTPGMCAPLSSGTATCTETESAGAAPYVVTADYPGDANYAAGTTSLTVNAESSPSGSDMLTVGGVTATATGGGSSDALTEISYGSDPVVALTDGTGYFDVAVSQPSTFTEVVVEDCNANVTSTTALEWYNPATSAWDYMSPVGVFTPGTPNCVSYTLNGSSSPTIAQLSGTVFGVIPAPTVCLAPLITSAQPTGTATVGTSYSFNVTTCSTAVPTIKGSGLPKGLVLVDNRDGTATIKGTPVVKDLTSYSGAITASVRKETVASQSFTITVNQLPVFKSKAKTLIYAGQTITMPYAVTTAYANPEPTLMATGLPSGVTLKDNGNGTGDFVGTPGATSGGPYTVTISATNVAGTVNQTFTMTDYQAPTFSGVPASATVTKGAMITPITFSYAGYPAPSVKASMLPKGLTAAVDTNSDTVTIQGTPAGNAVGTTAQITAKSKAGSATATIAFTVNS